MSVLADMFVTALLLSMLVAACLALLPGAPPRIRFLIAAFGLAAWVVPWPLIRLDVAVPPLDGFGGWFGNSGVADLAASRLATTGLVGENQAAYLGYVLVALFLSGLLWLIADCRGLARSLRSWRRRSRSGESLRDLLPHDLRNIRAEIRIVEGTRVAAASGWIRPTIWIGDRFTRADLSLVLVHEAWHIRRRDPVWMALVMAVRRVYWWNPVVAYFSRHAILMIEAACDRRCARRFGRRRYVRHLASMMLAAERSRSPRLAAAAAGSPGLNVMRLKMLNVRMRLRARDWLLISLFFVTSASIAGYRASGASVAMPERSAVAIPDTQAGKALSALLGAINGGDAELVRAYFGAYTPQEVELPSIGWTGGLQLLDIVSSDALSVEYVVEENESETKIVGVLEVADAAAVRVTRSELHALAAGSISWR